MPGYQLLQPPAVEPVLATLAKQWCKQDQPDDDAIFAMLITAAREYCETFIGRKLITQRWRMVMDTFPNWHRDRPTSNSLRPVPVGSWFWFGSLWGFFLPFGPVQSVDDFSYVDAAGTKHDLVAGQNYTVDLIGDPARVLPVFGRCWPLTGYAPNQVIVDFTCGYGADGTTVPQSICTVILMLTSYWYDNRDAFAMKSLSVDMSRAVSALLWQFRDVSF